MLKVKFKSNANCVKEENVDTKEENACDWKKKRWDPRESDTDKKLHIIGYFTTLGPQRIQCSKLIQTQKGLWQSTKV